ncbi:mCG147308 [Mus musculus]|jgi:hypothetical protein|nr:mCG147308 [Mus musculus]
MCLGVFVCLCAAYVPDAGAGGGQKRVLHPLKLKLWTVVDYHVDAGIEHGSEKAANTLFFLLLFWFLFCFCFFETGFLCIALAVLELT